MTALDRIRERSQPGGGAVAPRSGSVEVAAEGLARMRRLVDALGNPERRYRTIHVAGSKGKGSTAAYAAAILSATGRRTGRYTSPHLDEWRERIAVDGRSIGEDDLDRVAEHVETAMRRLEAERPGETPHNAFELLTAGALVHFAEAGCDAAVIEVGVGGRFDSTNVIEAEVAVITAIEAEHLDMLGPTLADVAWNKAGIIRRGRPCVTVTQRPIVLDGLRAEAARIGVTLLVQGDDWSLRGTAGSFAVDAGGATYAGLTIANPMAPMLVNAAAAIVAVAIASAPDSLPTPDQVQAGLDRGTLPGRFEVIDGEPPVVLDVAHTADSLAALGDAVRARYPGRPITALVGLLSDKDLDVIASAVAPWAEAVVATTAPSPRARPSSEIAAAMRRHAASVTDIPSPTDAWAEARHVTPASGVVVVTGGFALVADIRRRLLAEA